MAPLEELNRFVASIHHWRRLEHRSLASAKWLYAFMDNALKETRRLGYSPFASVKDLSVVVMYCHIDGGHLPISQLFPNLARLTIEGRGKIFKPHMLVKHLALKQLVALRLNREQPCDIALHDLLQELPALRYLEMHLSKSPSPGPEASLDTGMTVFTHRKLETLELCHGKFDAEIPHSCRFPSLTSLSIKGGGETMATSLPNPLVTNLTNLLSFTQLRALRLKDVYSSYNDHDLVSVFATIPTLEILFMHVGWKHWPLVQCRFIFDILTNDPLRSEAILPRLMAVFVTTDDSEATNPGNGEKEEEDSELGAYFTTLCAFRDSFIRFTEQRFLEGPTEGGRSTMCALRIARFEAKKLTSYSRGLDLGECLSGRLWRRACKRGFLR